LLVEIFGRIFLEGAAPFTRRPFHPPTPQANARRTARKYQAEIADAFFVRAGVRDTSRPLSARYKSKPTSLHLVQKGN
jgi:hypothetical protein